MGSGAEKGEPIYSITLFLPGIMVIDRKMLFWIVWGLGIAATTMGLYGELFIERTLEPVWVMAIAHAYASSALLWKYTRKQD
ncbi:MAG: hypothetical protein NWE89_07790 [Candidatus Bathyarchaeota archaeon]|nr:hypothetical protein [Candidatus Bathyarchaeota archaeon]